MGSCIFAWFEYNKRDLFAKNIFMTATAQTFQSSVFSQLDTQQMLAMSYMLHEIAEDMEDYYRVKTT